MKTQVVWTESARSLPAQNGESGCSDYVLVDRDGQGNFAFAILVYDDDNNPSSWEIVRVDTCHDDLEWGLDLTDVQYWAPLPIPAAVPCSHGSILGKCHLCSLTF